MEYFNTYYMKYSTILAPLLINPSPTLLIITYSFAGGRSNTGKTCAISFSGRISAGNEKENKNFRKQEFSTTSQPLFYDPQK